MRLYNSLLKFSSIKGFGVYIEQLHVLFNLLYILFIFLYRDSVEEMFNHAYGSYMVTILILLKDTSDIKYKIVKFT